MRGLPRPPAKSADALRIEGAILAALLAALVACQSVPVLPPLDPEDPALADVTVTLIPSPGRSFWDTPAANPAAALLSLATPAWWTDSFGQQLLVEQQATGRLARIEMRREGTRIMWSLAPLWNLGSGRRAAPDPNREASHLRVRILRFLANGVPGAPPPR
jgi:hypothetical protein